MDFIDTHCHLTSLDEQQLAEVFSNARQSGVIRMICIGAGEGITSARKAIPLTEDYEQIWTSIGIHPHDAGQDFSIRQLESDLFHPKVVALGETGLDFFRDWAPVEKQQTLFRETIALAKEHQKPLIIHCRDAAAETLQILKAENAERVGGVFHCYSEDGEFAKKLGEINFLVSFTGNITFKNARKLRDSVKQIPLSQMMLETDSPYMAPEPFRGTPSEPKHVYQVALKIAEIKEVSVEEVAAATTANAKRLFGLHEIAIDATSSHTCLKK